MDMEDTTRSPEEKVEESAADAARKAMEYLTLRAEDVVCEQSGASKVSTAATEGERRWKDGK